MPFDRDSFLRDRSEMHASLMDLPELQRLKGESADDHYTRRIAVRAAAAFALAEAEVDHAERSQRFSDAHEAAEKAKTKKPYAPPTARAVPREEG